MRKLLLFTLFFFLLMSSHADALSFSSISTFFNREPQISQINSLVADRAQVVENEQQQAQQIDVKRNSLEQKVSELKTRVSTLNDMFVHINKYARDSYGDSYALLNCTWYAKSQRPDISNSWGNANTWYGRAQAQGWSVGLTPKKGAVATTQAGPLGHVAYVIGVSLDGKEVTVSEMNYLGLGIISTRTVYYTEFRYIYELD